jgi:hypothetical protein
MLVRLERPVFNGQSPQREGAPEGVAGKMFSRILDLSNLFILKHAAPDGGAVL